jgi:plasmid maintenance system antidote protein VapI
MDNKRTAGYRLYEDTPLGARLRAAFSGASNAEIARKLGVHDSTIHTIVVTGTITARMLAKVISYTGCNLGWLLTGSTDS